MKNRKGLTLIELMIICVIIGVVLAILIPNLIKAKALDKNKVKNGQGERIEIQKVEEKVRSSRVSITKVGEFEDVHYYIVQDVETGTEYLISKYQAGSTTEGSVAIVKMEERGLK